MSRLKNLVKILAIIVLVFGFTIKAQADFDIVKEDLIVTRSEIVAGGFIQNDKWNFNEVWGSVYNYDGWEKAGLVRMLSKVTINGNSITPVSGDLRVFDKLYDATGASSFINHINGVAVLVQKARNVPVSMPLSIYPDFHSENVFLDDYRIKEPYGFRYAGSEDDWIFLNDFILVDDYRQVKFEIEPTSSGKFTGTSVMVPPFALDLWSPIDTVGVVQGQSMNDAGEGIPAYELFTGWEFDKITDSDDNEIELADLLALSITANRLFKIHARQLAGSLEITKTEKAMTGTIPALLAGAVFQVKETATGETYTVTTGTNGVALLENLPIGAYTVVEITPPFGYEPDDTIYNVSINNNETSQLNIENELIKIDITGTKTWEDEDDQDGIRPDELVVTLFGNGEALDLVPTWVKEDNIWTYTFEGVAKYDAEDEIEYSVEEEEVAGYESEQEGFDFVNTHVPKPQVLPSTGAKANNLGYLIVLLGVLFVVFNRKKSIR